MTPADELLAAADRLEALQGVGHEWFHAFGLLCADRTPHPDRMIGAINDEADLDLIVAAVNASKHLPALLRNHGERMERFGNESQLALVHPTDGDLTKSALHAIARAINGKGD